MSPLDPDLFLKFAGSISLRLHRVQSRRLKQNAVETIIARIEVYLSLWISAVIVLLQNLVAVSGRSPFSTFHNDTLVAAVIKDRHMRPE